jgi:hypothetical protein
VGALLYLRIITLFKTRSLLMIAKPLRMRTKNSTNENKAKNIIDLKRGIISACKTTKKPNSWRSIRSSKQLVGIYERKISSILPGRKTPKLVNFLSLIANYIFCVVFHSQQFIVLGPFSMKWLPFQRYASPN